MLSFKSLINIKDNYIKYFSLYILIRFFTYTLLVKLAGIALKNILK